VPKLKTHVQTIMTGALKNLALGCIPGSGKGVIHSVGKTPDRMAKAMVDVYSAIRPLVSLNVMDAVVCMEGNGPTGGRPLRLGRVLASTDALALDMVSFAMAGLDPEDVPHVREASRRSLGPESLEEIDILGDAFSVVKFELPSTFFSRVASFAGSFAPTISPSVSFISSKCTGCGNCAEACPGSAITIQGCAKRDKSKCIKCYVCHEVCENGAVRINRSLSRIWP
jgi:ferredoxin